MRYLILFLLPVAALAEPQHSMHHMRGGAMAQSADKQTCSQSTGWSDTVSPAQLQVIYQVLGTREHRLMHALWHAARGGLSSNESAEVTQAFGSGWKLTHPLCPAPGPTVNNNYNSAGEDFLFMHRQMREALQGALISQKLPCISGWKDVPDSKAWPIPDKDRSGPKSETALAQLKAWSAKLHDPNWLRGKSLSQVGVATEFTVHNNLHMRYATTQPPTGFAGVAQTGGAPIPFDGNFPSNWTYDQAGYNWLADPYSAAINPIFWKIHGYVDDIIDAWLAANNYSKIALDCGGDSHCYQWHGTWVGAPIELNIPKLPGDAGGSRSPHPDDTAANQRRMLHQWIGVIQNSKVGAPRGGQGGGNANDPFVTAIQRLCN